MVYGIACGLFLSKTPDLDPLSSEQSMEDVESMNEFEPLFAEEQPEVEKPVTTVQVCLYLFSLPLNSIEISTYITYLLKSIALCQEVILGMTLGGLSGKKCWVC